MKNWCRVVIETHPYFKEPDAKSYYGNKRFYVPKKSDWPMIQIGVTDLASLGLRTMGEGYEVSCSRKNDLDGWWEKCCVPKELICELIDILNEIKENE